MIDAEDKRGELLKHRRKLQQPWSLILQLLSLLLLLLAIAQLRLGSPARRMSRQARNQHRPHPESCRLFGASRIAASLEG